jgi:uncharacterized peroxidase-related enzyme
VSEKAFTSRPVEWKPWLDPVDAEMANDEQLAAIGEAPPEARSSPDLLALLHDPPSLLQSLRLFTSVMSVPQGLPRAERELASVIASMLNACVHCASVHSRRFVELSKKPQVMEALFADGFGAELEPRLRAIADFAEKLSRAPAEMTASDLAPLRRVGLDDLQILDLIHVMAMSASQNRLMLTLGEPLPPAED